MSKLDQIERILLHLIRLAEDEAIPALAGQLLFSPDEMRIYKRVQEGPILPKNLHKETGLQETRCKLLASNLRARGILDLTDEGYRIRKIEEPEE